MVNLTIRKLEAETLRGLKLRAVRNNRSVEEEVRQILNQAVCALENLGDLAVEFFGEKYGVELNLSRSESHEPVQILK